MRQLTPWGQLTRRHYRPYRTTSLPLVSVCPTLSRGLFFEPYPALNCAASSIARESCQPPLFFDCPDQQVGTLGTYWPIEAPQRRWSIWLPSQIISFCRILFLKLSIPKAWIEPCRVHHPLTRKFPLTPTAIYQTLPFDYWQCQRRPSFPTLFESGFLPMHPHHKWSIVSLAS